MNRGLKELGVVMSVLARLPAQNRVHYRIAINSYNGSTEVLMYSGLEEIMKIAGKVGTVTHHDLCADFVYTCEVEIDGVRFCDWFETRKKAEAVAELGRANNG